MSFIDFNNTLLGTLDTYIRDRIASVVHGLIYKEVMSQLEGEPSSYRYRDRNEDESHVKGSESPSNHV